MIETIILLLAVCVICVLLVLKIVEKYLKQKKEREERSAWGYSGGWEIGSNIDHVSMRLKD